MSKPPVTDFIAPEAAPIASKRSNPYLAFAARAGVGLLVVAILLWRYDARPVLRVIAREPLGYFVAAIVLYVAGQVMSSWRWQLLAAVVAVRARFRDFLAYYFVGMFTNLFVPGMLGGDAARALYLGRRTHRMGESVASIVADRSIGLIALFVVAGAAALAIPSALSASVTRITIVTGAISLAILLAMPLLALAVPYMPGNLRRAARLVLPYMKRPQALALAFVLSALLQISLGIGQWILAVGLGLHQPLSIFLLCVPIANFAAGFPVTLNGLGVRETAYLVLFGMAGMNRDDAIALGLLWFAATMLGGLTGAIAFAVTEFPERSIAPSTQVGDDAQTSAIESPKYT